MSPITGPVNGSDYYVREFDASTCSGENAHEIFENEENNYYIGSNCLGQH